MNDEIGELTGTLLNAGIRLAAAAIARYNVDVQAALHEELQAGAELTLTVTLSPSPRLTLKVGQLVAFEMAPEVDVSHIGIDLPKQLFYVWPITLDGRCIMPENTEEVARLVAEQERIVAACEAILKRASDDQRELSTKEKANLAQHRAAYDAIQETVSAYDSVAAMGDAPSAGRKTVPAPLERGQPALDSQQTDEDGLTRQARGKRWHEMFGSGRTADSAGWRSPHEFLQVVAARTHDQRLIRASANENVGSEGGWLVPQVLLAPIMDDSLRLEIVRPRCRVFPMTATGARIPSLDLEDRSQGRGDTLAGIALEWLPELGTGHYQTPRYRSQLLIAHRAAIYIQSSLELVAYAPTFGQTLMDAFSAGTARGLDYAFIHGTGAGQPLGVLNAPCLVSVAKQSGQVADTLMYDNITRMYARMLPNLIGDSIWMIHPSCVPQLLSLSVTGSAATGATMPPLFSQLANGSFSMLGRPVVVSDLCRPIGDQGDVIFAAWSAYAVGMRMFGSIEQSNAPGWTEYAQDYRLTVRVDGQPLYSKAVIPPFSAATLSPFVVLDAR